MADEPQTPASPQSATPAPSVKPLDSVSLGEFAARRAKGETLATAPAATPQPSEVKAPPVELPVEEPEGEETPLEAPAGDDKKPAQKPKGRFEERLGVLVRQRHDAERALESERQRSARLEAEIQQLQQPQQQPQRAERIPDGQPPDLNQYLAAGKTYEDWADAKTQYLISRAIVEDRQQRAVEAQQRDVQAALEQYPARLEAAQQKYPDFHDVVLANDRVELSPVMQAIALRSPHGADIMYWLGTHEAEANLIGAMTRQYPIVESYPLVEAHLLLLSGHSPGSNGQAGAKKAAVPVSQAPAPITPVGGGTTMQPVSLDTAPLGDYIKRRQAQIDKKRTG